jgi:hypothetical protein
MSCAAALTEVISMPRNANTIQDLACVVRSAHIFRTACAQSRNAPAELAEVPCRSADRYDVSPDGKTMTLHRALRDKSTFLAYTDKDGIAHRRPEYVLMFDRVE